MRDPARIRRILGLLEQYWLRNPDWRLGQLVVNLVRPDEPCPRVFHTEDDRLEEALRAELAKPDEPIVRTGA